MLSRRRWFAAAGFLAAGLFALPGKAVAGLFRHGRCKAPYPSCTPWPFGAPCPEIGSSVNITCPQTADPYTKVPTTFTVNGTYYLSSYGTYPAVKCVLMYEAGGEMDSPLIPVSPGSGTWCHKFVGANTGTAGLTV